MIETRFEEQMKILQLDKMIRGLILEDTSQRCTYEYTYSIYIYSHVYFEFRMSSTTEHHTTP